MMLPIMVETLVVGTPPAASVVILRPLAERSSSGRMLPIWIGPTEALSIGMAIEGSPHPRPMTHDLLSSVLDSTNTKLDHILIDRVEGTTFYATLFLTNTMDENDVKSIDARPSDSIALAIRNKAPMFVSEEVMDLASFPASLSPGAAFEVEAEEFHSFIESINPEDFIKPPQSPAVS